MVEAITPAAGTPAAGTAEPTDWKAALPEDARSNAAIKDIADVPLLVTAYLDQGKKLEGAIIPPAADATEEAWSAYYAKLGRPESADKYELTKPALPEGVSWTKEMDTDMAEMKAAAFKLGLSPKQAQGLAALYGEQVAVFHKTAATASEEAVSKLKGEYGTTYDNKVGLARKTAEKLGEKELLDFMDDKKPNFDPRVVRLFVKLAPSFTEDTTPAGRPAGPSGAADTDEAKAARMYPSANQG